MNIKKTLAFLLVLTLLLCGCTPQAEGPQASQNAPAPTGSSIPAKKAGFALSYDDTASLDPLANTNSLNLMLAGLVYEGLFQLDTSFVAQPLLCASYTFSENCTVWSFTLRPDAVFSDGTPLTPAHVAASLNTARTSELYSPRLSQVLSVTADEESITVTLASPNGNLPALLDIPITIPGPEGEPPLGTGNYRFSGQGSELSLTKNPYRRQETSLPISSIPLRATSTSDQRIAAFDAGLITAVSSDPTVSTALGYSCSYETWSSPTTSMLYLGFHSQSDFCSDPVLRKAISLAIDRSSLTGSLLSGYADPTSIPVSPASDLYDANLASEFGYSLSSAKALLIENGYTLDEDELLRTARNKQVKLNLLVNTDNAYRLDIADHLASELGKLGLTVTVTALPWEEFLLALSAGEFDLYLAQTKMTADFDLSPLLTGALNYGLFEDEDTLALLDLWRSSAGVRRITSARTLYRHLATVTPFTPICFQRTTLLTQWGSVSGATPTQQDPFHQFHLWTLR